jgi:tellurite resistance protein TehA-like permease
MYCVKVYSILPTRPVQSKVNLAVPFRFHGLYTIGVVIFLFDLVFFSLIILGTWLRYHYHPAAFKASFLHPTESLFIPAVMISIATKLINIAEYGLVDGKTGLWLIKTMIVLFWVYASGAVLFSVGIYLMMYVYCLFTPRPVSSETAYARILTSFTVGRLKPSLCKQ